MPLGSWPLKGIWRLLQCQVSNVPFWPPASTCHFGPSTPFPHVTGDVGPWSAFQDPNMQFCPPLQSYILKTCVPPSIFVIHWGVCKRSKRCFASLEKPWCFWIILSWKISYVFSDFSRNNQCFFSYCSNHILVFFPSCFECQKIFFAFRWTQFCFYLYFFELFVDYGNVSL